MRSIFLRLENDLHSEDAKNKHHVNSKTIQKFDIMSKIVMQIQLIWLKLTVKNPFFNSEESQFLLRSPKL